MVTGPAHSAAARAKLTLFFLEGRGRVRGSIRALTCHLGSFWASVLGGSGCESGKES